jgi:hypothetical protein
MAVQWYSRNRVSTRREPDANPQVYLGPGRSHEFQGGDVDE